MIMRGAIFRTGLELLFLVSITCCLPTVKLPDTGIQLFQVVSCVD